MPHYEGYDDPFASLPPVAPPRFDGDHRDDGPYRTQGGGGVGAYGPEQWMYPGGTPHAGTTPQPGGQSSGPQLPPSPNIPIGGGGGPGTELTDLDGSGGDPGRGPVTFQLPSGGSIGGAGSIPGSDLMARLRMFAGDTLENYNPYSNELVQEGLSLVDADLAEKRRRGMRDLDEMAAQRGIVGSSIEHEQRGQLVSDLERERSRFAFDLHREQAQAEQQGRALAAQVAQGALGEETRRWQAQRSIELQNRGLNIQEAQARATVELQQRAQELRERGLNMEEAFREAAFELDRERFGFEQQRWEDEFAQRERLAKMQIGAQTGAG